ncbi:MAG: NUDIX hydrolase [Acidimicrobiales bacterium]|nr:NUDIX hydrolase [Acidimicrobiales bacterium]RZV41839.1 MAG: NUDIX domain-containing protein [Acidimicrobiales bacterium]
MRESRRYRADDPALVGSSEARAAWHHIEPVQAAELAEVKRAFFQLTALEPDALLRTATPGHLTGSALILNHDATETLLLFHTKLQRWLQPGGHADGEANLARVALKEATEETGIEGLEIVDPAIDLDIHNVAPPGREPVYHYDVRFLLLAPVDAEPAGNHESQDIRWAPLDSLDEYGLDDGHHRMIRAGLEVAAELGVLVES